ncbi:hypothetical protein Ae505Ps2_0684c [Pseudonocardia sp. Ae505_Ps2]|nr:hypothetical protein Ae505Ps2_0684c [Pseudonocardia sp. Ae505_Ps2]
MAVDASTTVVDDPTVPVPVSRGPSGGVGRSRSAARHGRSGPMPSRPGGQRRVGRSGSAPGSVRPTRDARTGRPPRRIS